MTQTQDTTDNTHNDGATKKQVGRIVAGGYYDLQGVRIATKNRIRDIVRKRIENIPFDQTEEKKEEKTHESKYTDDKLFAMWHDLHGKGEISDDEHKYIIRCWEIADESEKVESKYKKAMEEYINTEPVYNEFLVHVKGIGPVLSANLIKEFGDCGRYDTVSKLWAHTGNDVRGGLAPRKRKGEDLTFSPYLRTLTWKISDCLMKSNKGIYREVFVTSKEKYLAREYKAGELAERFNGYKPEDTQLRKGHANAMALRKMRKLFLSHYWECARQTAGMDTRGRFCEELGHKNIITWKDAVNREQKTAEDKSP